MKKLIPILLLCALLLVGCGKKQDAPEGSGSAAPETEQTASGKKTSPAAKTDKAKETAAPAAASSAPKATSAPAGTSGKTSGGKTNPAVPAPTPTPKIETWEDAEKAQQQILDIIKVNPVGNWTDSASGAMMVIDGEFHGSILITSANGESSVWTFSGEYDPDSGVLSYTDGVKQTLTQSGMKTAYENSPGALVVKDGKLVWTDTHESRSITFTRDES